MIASASVFEGSLLGTMVAESIGLAVDGLEPGHLRHRYSEVGAILAQGPLRYGAATEMSVAMAESLCECGEFDGADMAQRLAAARSPGRGYGQGSRAALERLIAGVHWREAAAGEGGRTSFGNGAASRMALIGLLYSDDVEVMRWVAEEAAAITHQHALASEGAFLQAAAAGLAASHRGEDVSGPGFLLSVGAETEIREYRERYERAARSVERDIDSKRVVARFGNGTTALGSVVTAAFCFARHPQSFSDAVWYAVSLAGNTAAIAAMVGAIAGAYLGPEAIPRQWIDALAADKLDRQLLTDLASRLVSLENA